jgi:hypothetical protein
VELVGIRMGVCMTGYLGGVEEEAIGWIVLGEMEEGVCELVRVQKRYVIVDNV